MAETIKIGGELESTATGNKVADVANIKDKTKGDKSQAEINAEIDAAIQTETERAITAENNRYTKAETYNKSELNNMITTPNQQYISVAANSQTTDVTDVLPATGAANTVYRVGNWDGSQFDANEYSEYAWNGSQYIHLSTKTQIGEVFDISAYHATGGTLATYANLSAALDSNNGGGVPQSLQKGGMRVQFVHSIDNKYVQARCMAQNFTTDVTQWQGVDDEPTLESFNLVKSTGIKVCLSQIEQQSVKKIEPENKNVWIDKSVVRGWFGTNGNVVPNESGTSYISALIEVDSETSYYLTSTFQIQGGREYDENFNVLRNLTYSSKTISTGQNTKYIRIGFPYATTTENITAAIIQKGTSATVIGDSYIEEGVRVGYVDEELERLENAVIKILPTNRNLWTDKTYTRGWFNSDGGILPQSEGNSYVINELVEVSEGSYVLSGGLSVNGCRTFSSDKSYLGTLSVSNNVFEISSDVKYIRFSFTVASTTPETVAAAILQVGKQWSGVKTTYIEDNIRVKYLDEEIPLSLTQKYQKTSNLINVRESSIWHQGTPDHTAVETYFIHSDEVEVTGGGTLYIFALARDMFAKYIYDHSLTRFILYIIQYKEDWTKLVTDNIDINGVGSASSITLNDNTKYLRFVITSNSSLLQITPQLLSEKADGLYLYVGMENVVDVFDWVEYKEPKSILPPYYDDYIADKIDTLRNLDYRIGNHGDSFAFITDMHYPTNVRQTPNLVKKIKENCNISMVVNGGDTINGEEDKNLALKYLRAWMDDFKDFNPLVIRGNHDMNSNGNWGSSEYFTEDDYYAIVTKKFENVLTENNNYFIKDNVAQKIRYIFLDTDAPDGAVIDDTQINWLKTRIQELESGWSTMVFAHQVYTDDTNIDDSGTKICDALDEIYDTVDATIIGIMAGHTHSDYIHSMPKGYKIIITTCDRCVGYETISGVLRQAGSVTESAFDIVHIDTSERKVYITRIGGGNDRQTTY